MLLRKEALDSPTWCAKQLYLENSWRVSYTTDFEKAATGIDRLKRELASPVSAKSDSQAADGAWGACFEDWFFKLDVSSDWINELAESGKKPPVAPTFLDRINSPQKLESYLNSILVSDISKFGKDNRKELNYTVSALLRLISRRLPPNLRLPCRT